MIRVEKWRSGKAVGQNSQSACDGCGTDSGLIVAGVHYGHPLIPADWTNRVEAGLWRVFCPQCARVGGAS